MNSFFRELKERKVYRVALGYGVSCLARHPDQRDDHARLSRARMDFADLYYGRSRLVFPWRWCSLGLLN
jgi:hypothetical protein